MYDIEFFFNQDWVRRFGDKDYSVLEVACKSGSPQVLFPYMIKSKWGLDYITMPPLTQSLGPYFASSLNVQSMKQSKLFELIGSAVKEVIDSLPEYDSFVYRLNPWCPFVVPWMQAGFKVTPRFTYIIDYKDGLKAVYNKMSSTCKNAWNRKEEVKVVECYDAERLKNIVTQTYFARGGVGDLDPFVSQSLGYFHKDNSLCLIVEYEGKDLGYIILGQTPFVSTCILAGSLKEGPNLSTEILFCHAIQECSKVSRYFNFEGSMLRGVERFYRKFGGEYTPYYEVSKVSSRFLKYWYRLKGIV